MKMVGPRMANPDSREIYFLDKIFAAAAWGSAEDAVKDFAESIGEDGYVAPVEGDKLLVREHRRNPPEENEWFEVEVPCIG